MIDEQDKAEIRAAVGQVLARYEQEAKELREDFKTQLEANKGGKWKANGLLYGLVAIVFLAAGWLLRGL